MPSCEKCWRDAGGDAMRYSELCEERADNPCTPEQQAGPEATECDDCKTMTVHEYAGICMACGKDWKLESEGDG